MYLQVSRLYNTLEETFILYGLCYCGQVGIGRGQVDDKMMRQRCYWIRLLMANAK